MGAYLQQLRSLGHRRKVHVEPRRVRGWRRRSRPRVLGPAPAAGPAGHARGSDLRHGDRGQVAYRDGRRGRAGGADELADPGGVRHVGRPHQGGESGGLRPAAERRRQLRPVRLQRREPRRHALLVLLCALASFPASDCLAPGATFDRRRWCGQLVASGAVAYPSAALAIAEDGRKKLEFVELPDGVKVADIALGEKGEAEVEPTSRVTFHVVGRLAGKQGWTFEDSKTQEDDPYRLELGKGKVVKGLEEGMLGMRVGGRRRIVIPSTVGYLDRSLEPIPRDFGNRQRLYTTVLNDNRKDRERAALGSDLAGLVVLDVELLRIDGRIR